MTSVQDQFSGTNFGSLQPADERHRVNSSFSAASDAPLSASFRQTRSLALQPGAAEHWRQSQYRHHRAATLASVNANIGGNLNAQIADGSDLNVTAFRTTSSTTSVDLAIEANAAEAIAGTSRALSGPSRQGVAGVVAHPRRQPVASTIAAVGSAMAPASGLLADLVSGLRQIMARRAGSEWPGYGHEFRAILP